LDEKKVKKNKSKKILIVISIIILILVIIFAVAFIFASSYINDKLDKIDYVDIPQNEIEVNTGITENIPEYRNIVLLGLDTREDTFSGSRSDCIIIVTINNNTHDVSLTSVYRDTYLDINGHGLDKITHAYAYGGALLTMNTLNKNLDLNINEFVTVNFETVKTVVDSIGGVNITVTDAEANVIPGISGAGTYNLNGAQALSYSRIRKIDTDYKRTERMRTVLTAVFNKVKTKNLSELNNLLDTILPHVSTNIKKDEIIELMPQILSFNIQDSEGWPYNTRGKTMSLWYGIPVTLESNVQELHANLFGDTEYEVSDTVKEISDRIINKTGYTE